MNRFIVAVIGVFGMVGLANAGPITLLWDESPGATSYDIEASTDNGVTWAVVASPLASVCANTECNFTLTAPSTGRVLYRFVAKNAIGHTPRYDAGMWYCESCKPPSGPLNVGIQ